MQKVFLFLETQSVCVAAPKALAVIASGSVGSPETQSACNEAIYNNTLPELVNMKCTKMFV